MSQIIHTDQAPAAIGPYSQAVRAGNTVYFSGQIPLDPATGEIVPGDIGAQARRAFDNLKAVAEAAGGSLDKIVRLGLYITDLGQFAAVNAVMQGISGAVPGAFDHRSLRPAQGCRLRGRCSDGDRVILHR